MKHLLTFLLLVVIFTSCSIERRHYLPGFHVERNAQVHKAESISEKSLHLKGKEPSQAGAFLGLNSDGLGEANGLSRLKRGALGEANGLSRLKRDELGKAKGLSRFKRGELGEANRLSCWKRVGLGEANGLSCWKRGALGEANGLSRLKRGALGEANGLASQCIAMQTAGSSPATAGRLRTGPQTANPSPFEADTLKKPYKPQQQYREVDPIGKYAVFTVLAGVALQKIAGMLTWFEVVMPLSFGPGIFIPALIVALVGLGLSAYSAYRVRKYPEKYKKNEWGKAALAILGWQILMSALFAWLLGGLPIG